MTHEQITEALENVWEVFEKAALASAPPGPSFERDAFDRKLHHYEAAFEEIADLLQSREECAQERDTYADAIEEYLRDLGYNVWQWVKDPTLRRLRDALNG